jgi:hypothetical protein
MLLTHTDLHSLEEYSKIRENFKKAAINHRKQRQISIGKHMTLHFEDRVTVKYQIQEMLLVEKTFTQEGIQDELDAYNPLVPTGTNLKATLTIEYGDPVIRAEMLKKLRRVEDKIFLQIGDDSPIFAIADEDIDRSNDEKTSAVHFLRWEFTTEQIKAFENLNNEITVGVDHENFQYLTKVDISTQEILARDFYTE